MLLITLFIIKLLARINIYKLFIFLRTHIWQLDTGCSATINRGNGHSIFFICSMGSKEENWLLELKSLT